MARSLLREMRGIQSEQLGWLQYLYSSNNVSYKGSNQREERFIKHFRHETKGNRSAIPAEAAEQRIEQVMMMYLLRLKVADQLLHNVQT